MYTTTRMDLDGYISAAREVAEYCKRSARRRGKKYNASGWKFYESGYRGSRYGKVLADTDYTYYDTQAWSNLKKSWKGFVIAKSSGDEEKMQYYENTSIRFCVRPIY